MSEPFTSPANASWQELLDEITLAYSERRQAIGQSAYIPTDDKDVQAANYWVALQSWLESNCTSFIDHVNGPFTPDQTDFLYFTIDTWRDAAELDASGFTRKYGPKESLITDYGKMQISDVIGPWNYDELQRGFGVLKWRKADWTSSIGRPGHGASGFGDSWSPGLPGAGWGAALSELSSDWYVFDVNNGGVMSFAYGVENHGISYQGLEWYDWVAEAVSYSSVYYIGNVATTIPHAFELYLKGIKDPWFSFCEINNFNAQGTGLIENQFKLMSSSGEVLDASWISAEVGNNSVPSFSTPSAYDCHEVEFEGNTWIECSEGHSYEGFTVGGSLGLIKYNFTNA